MKFVASLGIRSVAQLPQIKPTAWTKLGQPRCEETIFNAVGDSQRLVWQGGEIWRDPPEAETQRISSKIQAKGSAKRS